jgi:hypothetical protein
VHADFTRALREQLFRFFSLPLLLGGNAEQAGKAVLNYVVILLALFPLNHLCDNRLHS